jgi:hypothetical protein
MLFWKHLFLSSRHNDNALFCQVLTTELQRIQSYTLAVFKPGIFCYVGGRDDHYATPPGLEDAFVYN